MVLSLGKIIKDESAEEAVDYYLDLTRDEVVSSGAISWNLEDAPGSDSFRLLKVELLSSDGSRRSQFSPQESIDLTIDYQLKDSLPGMRLVVQVLSLRGDIAFTTTDQVMRNELGLHTPGTYRSICSIPGGLLNLTDYSIKIWAGVPGVKYLLHPQEFIRFSVTGIGNHGSTYIDQKSWPGVVSPKLEWKAHKMGES
jgi:lipopolysaccharide transport system ATP-binding protein